MRRLIPLIVAAAFAIALATIFVRVQPRGSATIFRSGERIVMRSMPLYIRAAGTPCRMATVGDRAMFDAEVSATSTTNDEVGMRVRFTYLPPRSLPRDWPAGEWCTALKARVAAGVGVASSRFTVSQFLDSQRATGDQIASDLERHLRRAGLQVTGLSARIDLPEGFGRLRPVPEIAGRSKPMPPVIFIGLDGADWQMLDRLMAGGIMPNLKQLVATGSAGILESELPPLSPLVWTTMMTGAGPLEHGVLDFARFNPYTHEKEPITSDERRLPAIWNMMTEAGKSAAVFGLWATYPAEPLHAVNVSDRLFTFLYIDAHRPPRVVYPPLRESWAGDEASGAERGVDLARMREYLPSMDEAEFAVIGKTRNPYAQPAAALRRILVETEIYRRLSTDYLRSRPRLPDLTIVYFEGTDTIGHVFAPFAPPKLAEVSQADFERYNGAAERYFREIDAILGGYIELARRGGANMAIASDHGFRWTDGRPTEISSIATATAAKWHRYEGIYVLWGPNIAAAGGHTRRGGIRQICATLQALSGIPMTGTPLPGSPKGLPPADYAHHFERAIPPPPPMGNRAGEEDLAKLRALGYIGANESPRSAVALNDTRTSGAQNNAGLILRQQRRLDEAVAAFQRALAIDPRYASAMWNLSETLFDANRDLDRADALLVSALQNGLADGARAVIVRAIAYRRSSRADRSLRLLDSAVAVAPDDAQLRIFRGRYRLEGRDCSAALEDFFAAEQARPDDAIAWASAGLAQLCLGDSAAARESFARSLQIDPNQPMLRRFVGR